MTEADYAKRYPIFIEREMVRFFKNSWEKHTKGKELTWFSFRAMRRGVLDELKKFLSKGPWDSYRPSLVVDSHIQEDSSGNICIRISCYILYRLQGKRRMTNTTFSLGPNPIGCARTADFTSTLSYYRR